MKTFICICWTHNFISMFIKKTSVIFRSTLGFNDLVSLHISFVLVLGLCPDCWSISMTEIFQKLEHYCSVYHLLSLRFLLQSGHHCRTLLSPSDEKTAHLMGQHCPICMLKVKSYQCVPRDPDATTELPFSSLTRH